MNEVIADDSATNFRNSQWYQICGEDFVAEAFKYAHEADPKAILFYNDYNTEQPVKREKIYRMLKKMLAAGIPVHGIGLQAHWSINTPTQEELEKSIQLFSSLGLQVQITELDISVYAGRQGGQIIQGQRRNSNNRLCLHPKWNNSNWRNTRWYLMYSASIKNKSAVLLSGIFP